jgi:DMSO/TMAO reductase YedYZ molybdopterin-dependent catalytic subunit
MITRGFEPKRPARSDRVPPGQYEVDSFPVLTAGPTQHVDPVNWTLTITDGAVSADYSWDSFHALGSETILVDIHCVTHWTRLDTSWEGVPVSVLFDDAGVGELPYAVAISYGGYVTNLPTEDLLRATSLVATGYEGEPLEAEHGGPARLLVPHLYLWKSAKWIREIRLVEDDRPGFWESAGYHIYGDPWQEQRYFGD